MKLNYLFDSNAVLVQDENPKEIHSSYTFNFLGEKIIWKAQKPGLEVVLEVISRDRNFKKKIEKLLKFASLVVYRDSHVDGFRYLLHANAEVGRIPNEAGLETRFVVIGNESLFNEKMWSMLSFYLEAKNSTSFYYKFICLYKIIEIDNLRYEKRNGKKILVEDSLATQKYIEVEINNILTQHEVDELNREVKSTMLKNKNVGEYFEHLFRDAFAHTGYLTRNHYKFGYPTMNPTNFDDYLRYQKAVSWFDEIAKRAIKKNEPKLYELS